MKVHDILTTKGRAVETIRPDATVDLAVHRLSALGMGALVVSADGTHMEGVLSERDVVRALAKHGTRVLEASVASVMSRFVPACTPNTPINDAMAEMTRSRHRHLPVLDQGVLAGMLSIGDVVKSRLEELELEASVLRNAYIAHR